MTPEEFAQIKQGVIGEMMQAPQTLSEEAARFSKDFGRANLKFDSRDKVIAAIKTLTQQQLVDFFHQAVIAQSGMSILSQVAGSQGGKMQYASPEGWRLENDISALQQSMPLVSEKP